MRKPRVQLKEDSLELVHALSLARKLRASGMSQTEMALKTKIPKGTIGSWFQGISKPSAAAYEKLKAYFGESI